MNFDSRIYVAGASTLIGSAIARQLDQQGYGNVLTGPGDDRRMVDSAAVDALFADSCPEYVFLAAGDSGGIIANTKYPAQLMLDNLLVECNVIDAAHRHRVAKLLYLASSCVYPRECPQPVVEEALLTGPLEPTNEAYAVAKIAGIKLCQSYNNQFGSNFVTAVPANAFGPDDDFSEEDSHVIPGLIGRMHNAKALGDESVIIWGSGTARRDFIFADDLADACIFVMNHYDQSQPVNIGSGTDISIGELASLIKDVVGYTGLLCHDTTRPDGMPRKSLDSSKLAGIGWRPATMLRDGIAATYQWFSENQMRESPVRAQ